MAAELPAVDEACPSPNDLAAAVEPVPHLWRGLSSLVDQLRPKAPPPHITTLPEELVLCIVERAALASIADAGQLERLAPLAQTCSRLRFVGQEHTAEHLARALYPPPTLMPACSYTSWRARLHHDNAQYGMWCIDVRDLACHATGPNGSYCEARLQAVALDWHDSVAEIVLLLDAAGDAAALSERMLHETRLCTTIQHADQLKRVYLRGSAWSRPVYRLLGPGRQICEISFPAEVLLDGAVGPPLAERSSEQPGAWSFSLWALKFKVLRMGSQLARTTTELAKLFRREGAFQTLPLPYDAEARGPNSWASVPTDLQSLLRQNRGLTWATLNRRAGEGGEGGEGDEGEDELSTSWRHAIREAWAEHFVSDSANSDEGGAPRMIRAEGWPRGTAPGREAATPLEVRRREDTPGAAGAPRAWPADARFRCQPGWQRLDAQASVRSPHTSHRDLDGRW